MSRLRIAVACRQATSDTILRQVMSWVESKDAAVPKEGVCPAMRRRISELTHKSVYFACFKICTTQDWKLPMTLQKECCRRR
jgi:hypothetical protein